MSQRCGGLIQFQAAGRVFAAKGNFTWNLGKPKRKAVIGSSGVHGFAEEAQVAFIEGEITDPGDVDVAALVTYKGVSITLELANGKVVVLTDAWYAGEGTGNSDEGNIGVRFEGAGAVES